MFLPAGGPTNVPTEFTELPTVAARLGDHTVILAYRNEAPIAALPTANPPGCGSSESPTPASSTCAKDAREEILDGGGESSVVNVDRANSTTLSVADPSTTHSGHLVNGATDALRTGAYSKTLTFTLSTTAP